MVRHQFKLYGAALALAVGLFGGVAYADEDAASAEDSGRAAQQGAGEGQVMVRSDGQIAQILSSSNQGEIAQAKVALTRARSQAVKAFARHMISAHSEMQQRQTALYRSLRIKTENSQLGSLIGAHGSSMASYLRKQPAKSFDRVYMSLQVMSHRFTLKVLDKQLIPNATDKALREELQRTRTEIVSHLEQARAIRASLGKGKGKTPSGAQVTPKPHGH
jgi:predicted outer membrane protein